MSVWRSVVRVMPLASIQQKRWLPVSGRVVVNQGQTVKATETVAEAHLEPRYHLINVARALKVPRAEADHYIVCEVGEVVHEGDVLAERGGLLRKVVHAPADGEVLLVGDGQVLVREYNPPWELKAGCPGKVAAVFPGRGVAISTVGSVVDGVWGNDKTVYGMLHVATGSGNDVLTPDMLGVERRGLVLVAGVLDDAHVLEIAAGLPLRALIVGSMKATLIPEALKAPFPVLVVDGFGTNGMNERAFRLLSTSESRNVAVLADTPDVYQARRPAIILPLATADSPPEAPDAAPLENGALVRVVRAPYTGALARVVALPSGVTRFPNGVRAPAAEIRLENGERVLVPAANLEILVQS